MQLDNTDTSTSQVQHKQNSGGRMADAQVHVPDTQNMVPAYFKYFNGNILEPPMHLLKMPPSSTLKAVETTLISSEFKFVKFPFGVLKLEGVRYLLYLHAMKLKHSELKNERNWLEDMSIPFNVNSPPNINILLKFKNDLSNLSKNDALPNHVVTNSTNSNTHINCGFKLTMKEASSLACDRWLMDGNILRFIDILMSLQQDIFVCYLCDVHDLVDLGKRVSRNYNSKITKIVFMMNVIHEDGTTKIGNHDIDVGNHFSFCVMEICNYNINVQYIDTLRYPFPQSLRTDHIPSFLCGYYPNISLENFEINCHTLSQNCMYPKQSGATVCGPATIVGVALLIFNPILFKNLVCSKAEASSVSRISHLLPYIDKCSKLLRFCIIEWLYTSNVDLNNIFLRQNSSLVNKPIAASSLEENESSQISRSCLEDNVPVNYIKPEITEQSSVDPLLKAHESSGFLKKPEITQSHIVRKHTSSASLTPTAATEKNTLNIPDSIIQFLHKIPSYYFKKRDSHFELRFWIKGDAKHTCKSFKCNHLGSDDKNAKLAMQTFLNSDEFLEKLKSSFQEHVPKELTPRDSLKTLNYNTLFLESLEKMPSFKHNKRSSTLEVCCVLKECGTKISKYFKCSADGFNDSAATNNIKSFIESDECHIWALAKMSSVNTKQWEQVEDIKVGIETKYFFDSLNFDVLNDLHCFVEQCYQDNMSTLKVSVVENKHWGKTHRYDEFYKLKEGQLPSHTVGVTRFILCASKTSECRTVCGSLLSELNMFNGSTSCSTCPACFQDVSSPNYCQHCSVNVSRKWHKTLNGATCDTCFSYEKKNGIARPAALQIQVPQCKASYDKHFRCGWQMKLVLYKDDLSTWKVFKHKDNTNFHRNQPSQSLKRPSLTIRDSWDIGRVAQKSTPKQMFVSSQRKNPIFFNSDINSTHYHKVEQIRNRCLTIDRHMLQDAFTKKDDIPLPGSDWRNAEKILESHYKSTLFFQRGDDALNRPYHAIIAENDGLFLLRSFGKFIIGHDVKHDFMAVRFKTSLITFTDLSNATRAAALAVCNKEDHISHAFCLEIILGNVPCSNSNCTHPQELYIFNDGNGFFSVRPCSFNDGISPFVQHDKDSAIRNAVEKVHLKSVLCNFHGLSALRRHLVETSNLQLLLRPLETGFKVIMRSWSSDVRLNLVQKYKDFINFIIPVSYLSDDAKSGFLNYLETYWFNSPLWSNLFTAEPLYEIDPSERRNPLVLTDNPTERKFRDIDETFLHSHLNRSIAQFFLLCLNQVLHSDVRQCQEVMLERKDTKRTANILSWPKEIEVAQRGIQLNTVSGHNIISSKSDKSSCWKLVKSSTSCPANNTMPLPSSFFTEEFTSSKCASDIYETIQPTRVSAGNLHQLMSKIDSDHSYNAVSKSKSVLGELDRQACGIFKETMSEFIPNDLLCQLNDDVYICNLELSVCSCYHFVMKGQPYFCKHLYALLAEKNKIVNLDSGRALVHIYSQHVPTFKTKETFLTTEKKPIKLSLPIIDNLFNISHVATDSERTAATAGSILKLLHDHPIPLSNTSGRLAKRAPHNLGKRRTTGCIKDLPAIRQEKEQLFKDPYRPDIDFCKNATDRHGGRKRVRPCKRAPSLATLVYKFSMQKGYKCKPNDFNDLENDTADINDFLDHNLKKRKLSLKKSKKIALSHTLTFDTELENKHIMCPMCAKDSYRCSTQKALLVHIGKVHGMNLFGCTYCSQETGASIQFDTLANLDKHIKECHKKNTRT